MPSIIPDPKFFAPPWPHGITQMYLTTCFGDNHHQGINGEAHGSGSDVGPVEADLLLFL